MTVLTVATTLAAYGVKPAASDEPPVAETCGIAGTLSTAPPATPDLTAALTYTGSGTACTSFGASPADATVTGGVGCGDGTGTGRAVLTWADGSTSVVDVTIEAGTPAVTMRGTIGDGARSGTRVVLNLVASSYDARYTGPACGSGSSESFPASGTLLAIGHKPPTPTVAATVVVAFFSPTPASSTSMTFEQLAEVQQNAAAAAIAIPSGIVSDPTSVTTVEEPGETVNAAADPSLADPPTFGATERGYLLRGGASGATSSTSPTRPIRRTGPAPATAATSTPR